MARVGREATIMYNGVELIGVRTLGLKVNGAPVDITSGDSNGYRTLYGKRDVMSVDIAVGGVAASAILKADSHGETARAFTHTTPDGFVISGNCFVDGYEETDPHDGEGTFQCNLLSTGTVTVTPPSPIV